MPFREVIDTVEYKKEVVFHIPAVFSGISYDIDDYIYGVLQKTSIVRDNVKFAVYGCPQGCIWNGGRYIGGEVLQIDYINRILSNFTQTIGCMFQFTFTNTELKEMDVYDRFGNALLKEADRLSGTGNIEVLVASPILEEYIRSEYPRIKIARSIVQATKPSPDLFEKYSTIVVPIKYNRDLEYIKNLAENANGGCVEMLVDEQCSMECPRRVTHYQSYNQATLYEYPKQSLSCTTNNQHKIPIWFIEPEELNNYIDLGVTHFKLSGREELSHFIETAVYYMCRKNEQFYIRQQLYRTMKHWL